MPLINIENLSKNYKVTLKCKNCLKIQEALIPKGTTVQEFLTGYHGLCSYCGCATLEVPKDSETENKKPIKKDIDDLMKGGMYI